MGDPSPPSESAARDGGWAAHGFLGCVTRRTLRHGEPPEERARKAVWVPCTSIMLAVTAIFTFLGTSRFGAYAVGAAGGMLVCAVGVGYPLLTRRLPLRLAEVVLVAGTVCILLSDWSNAAAMTVRGWPLVILVCDLMLTIDAGAWARHTVLHGTAVWLAVTTTEDAYRWGLYDVPGWTEPSAGELEGRSNCSNPPCKEGPYNAMLYFIFYAACLYIDFVATYGFAKGQRDAQQRVVASVRVAERVAHLLAAYATAEAQQAVDEDGEKLPPALRDALELLLNNLTRYRPFLPESILQPDEERSPALTGEVCSDATEPLHRWVLPQLQAAELRWALQCVVSQCDGPEREELAELLADCARMCVAQGDHLGAAALMECGWDPPAALRGELALAHSPPGTPRFPSTCRRASALSGDDISSMRQSFCTFTAEQRPGAQCRYGDGADAPSAPAAPVPLWPPGYTGPSAREAVESLAQWHSPKGEAHWPRRLVEDLVADSDTCSVSTDCTDCTESIDLLGPDTIAIFAYTAQMDWPVVWAVWQGSRWALLPSQDAGAKRSAWLSVTPSKEELAEAGVAGASAAPWVAKLPRETPCGTRVYGQGGDAMILRYTNARGGDPEWSPLRDTAVWAPRPARLLAPDAPFALTRADGAAPPSGVLEFIASRSAGECIERPGWRSVPVGLEHLARLRQACLAQKNQQRPKPRLCRKADGAFSVAAEQLAGFGPDPQQLAPALRAAYAAKCPGANPTPAQIAHACEVGLLQWGGRWTLLAITDSPRCAVPLASHAPCSAELLWRVDNAHPQQPFQLVNGAMRAQQWSLWDAELRGTLLGQAALVARQPDEPPPAPVSVQFTAPGDPAEGPVVVWSDTDWRVVSGACPGLLLRVHELRTGAWALPQYRALIWRLDCVLRALPAEGAPGRRRKGYRGLAGVTLDSATYSRGRVVTFGAFTSTSDDQGVAADFAMGDEGAVIFTTFSCTGRCIAPWSRFGREMEVLLPPNTLHLVTEALSAEHAAILDKSKLQVFDLQELTVGEAVAHLAKEGALKIGDSPGVLRQAERAATHAATGAWAAAARELLAAPEAPAGAQTRVLGLPVRAGEAAGVVVLLLESPSGRDVGAGIDPAVWSAFFERAERKARARGGRLLATHVGTLMVHITASSAEVAALAAVELAAELIGAQNGDVASPRPLSKRDCSAPTPTTDFCPLLPPPPSSPPGPLPQRRVRASPRYSRAGPKVPDGTLAVYCGVSVGTVHCGFAGSSAQRVEIADGPAVRRARAMAAYALHFGLGEVVADAAAAGAARKAGITTWTTDLVALDPQRDLREPLVCVAAQGSELAPAAAERIEAAWEAVVQAGGELDPAAVQHMEDCIARVPVESTVRAAAALREALAAPATYCYELEGAAC